MKKYILASSSPRRKELLQHIVDAFEIIVPDVDENIDKPDPEKLVLDLSRLKAEAISKDFEQKDAIIIAADTIVVHDDKVLGKPKDYDEAFETLEHLSGVSHFVYTGVCIKYNETDIRFCEKTKVHFRELSDEEIKTYIETMKPYDKAGSYGIQESDFCIELEGLYSNVMGLPIERIQERLAYFEALPAMPKFWKDFIGLSPRATEKIEATEKKIAAILAEKAAAGITCYPPRKQIYRALELCSPEELKVVIIGQDPYHGDGQAEGLAFSVAEGNKLQPSLRNIFKELIRDNYGELANDANSQDAHTRTGGAGATATHTTSATATHARSATASNDADASKKVMNIDLSQLPTSGSLVPWTKQGVLLLNRTLTVEAHRPLSHQKIGWQEITGAIVSSISEHAEHIVFVLWGGHAQELEELIDSEKHLIIKSSHPSPLSARRGFEGSHPFSQINAYLLAIGKAPINWRLPSNPTLF